MSHAVFVVQSYAILAGNIRFRIINNKENGERDVLLNIDADGFKARFNQYISNIRFNFERIEDQFLVSNRYLFCSKKPPNFLATS